MVENVAGLYYCQGFGLSRVFHLQLDCFLSYVFNVDMLEILLNWPEEKVLFPPVVGFLIKFPYQEKLLNFLLKCFHGKSTNLSLKN